MRNWPPAALRLRTERLELRWLDDDLLDDLVDLAAAGIHPADEMPFATPWSTLPDDELRLRTLRHHWRMRADLSPGSWTLAFGVISDGVLVGVQDLAAAGFAVRRTVATGSWLGRAHQGRGIGTEMRRAVLSLAFDHLGAERAESGWLDGNVASERVARRLGYSGDGRRIHAIDGRRRTEQRVSIELDAWRAGAHGAVRVDGLDACRSLLGAPAEPAPADR